jgi:hypothetical protein
MCMYVSYYMLLMQVQCSCQILASFRMQLAIRMAMGGIKYETRVKQSVSPISATVAPDVNQIGDVFSCCVSLICT